MTRPRHLTAGAILALAPPLLAQQADVSYDDRDFTTSHGDTHVEGTTDAAAFFGWGYAMSVDRFFLMEIEGRELRGTTAELLGAKPPGSSPRSPLGVGNQSSNFYAQGVPFRWHDTSTPPGVSPYAHTVFNPGNSIHPNSCLFMDHLDMWARDGVDFEATQADPTRYMRPAPLQD